MGNREWGLSKADIVARCNLKQVIGSIAADVRAIATESIPHHAHINTLGMCDVQKCSSIHSN